MRIPDIHPKSPEFAAALLLLAGLILLLIPADWLSL